MSKLLYKEKKRNATFLELFFDLAYVAIIRQATHLLVYTNNGFLDLGHVVNFLFFTLIFTYIWFHNTTYFNLYGRDESKAQSLFVFSTVFFIILIGMTIGEISSNIEIISLSLSMILLLNVVYTLKDINTIPHKKTVSYIKIGTLLITVVLIITSFYFMPNESPMIISIILIVEVIGSLIAHFFHIEEDYDNPHLIERSSLLVLIILGEGIIFLMDSDLSLEFSFASLFPILVLYGSLVVTFIVHFAHYDQLHYSDSLDSVYKIFVPMVFIFFGVTVLSAMIEHVIIELINLNFFKGMFITSIFLIKFGLFLLYTFAKPDKKHDIRITLTIQFLVTLILTILSNSHLMVMAFYFVTSAIFYVSGRSRFK